jgi:hypothetical protein
MMGVLRVFDWTGQQMAAAPYFGGSVRFGGATRHYTAVLLRLDLPTGQQVPVWLDRAYETPKHGSFTVRLPRIQ